MQDRARSDITIGTKIGPLPNEWFPMVSPNPTPRPYPTRYVSSGKTKDGTEVTIRPIRPEDETLMVKFHESLSDRTVYMRYFCSLNLSRRTAHERLAHICSCDYSSEMVLVAEGEDPNTARRSILAVGRLNKLESNREAEVALLVADPYQGLGLGTELLRRLLGIARDEGLRLLTAEMFRDNIAVQAVFKKCGFRLSPIDHELNEVQAVLDL
jgi:acetyltransferase